jgi:hypothetical protein
MKRWLGARPLEDDASRLLTWIRTEAGGLTHNILSATHTDTISGAVAQGDLMVGESTPLWNRLALGADTFVLRSDGTDALWADPTLWVPIAPVAQNDMIIADATPAWSILTGPVAQYERLESGAGAFVPAWTLNLGMADNAYIGIPAGGRLVFDLTPAPDQVQITDADLYFATAAHGIIHVDGVTAGYVLRADGTRYVPADPTTTLPLAPVAQGDLIIADATPAWSILTLGAAAGYALVSTATTAEWDQTPTWTGLHTFNDGWLLGGGTADLDGIADALVLDGDGDTTISAPTDDQIDIEVAGADDFTITANAFNVLSGSTIVMADNTWAGLGPAAGRIEFDDQATDEINLLDCAVGIGTSAPQAVLEVEDGGTSADMVVKITQDDNLVRGIVIGNDSSSTTDTHGLGLMARANGAGYIWAHTSAAENLILQPVGYGTGNVGIGATDTDTLAGKLRINNLAAAAQAVLALRQNDVDEAFLRLSGYSLDTDLTYSLVEEGDQASETRAGWLKIFVIDDGDQIADQAYFIPFYTLSA